MFNDAASVADTDHFDIDELDHHLGDVIHRRAGEAPHPEREPISVLLDQQFGAINLAFWRSINASGVPSSSAPSAPSALLATRG